MAKKLKHLKSKSTHQGDIDKQIISDTYDHISYELLELSDERIDNNIWISNDWDVKRGTYKVYLKIEMSVSLSNILNILNSNLNINNKTKQNIINKINYIKSIHSLKSLRNNTVYYFLKGLVEYVNYNNFGLDIDIRIFEDYWSDSFEFTTIFIVDFNIESKNKISI